MATRLAPIRQVGETCGMGEVRLSTEAVVPKLFEINCATWIRHCLIHVAQFITKSFGTTASVLRRTSPIPQVSPTWRMGANRVAIYVRCPHLSDPPPARLVFDRAPL